MTRARLNRRLPRNYFSNAPIVAPIKFPAGSEDPAGPGVEVAGAGLSSAPASPGQLKREQLHAARTIFPPPAVPDRIRPNALRCQAT